MANTYVLIASTTVGSGGASSITFSSIPSTYTDLVVKVSARTNGTGNDQLFLRFNNSSVAAYSRKSLYGLSGSTYSDSTSSQTEMGMTFANSASATTNTFSNNEFYIPNYTGSTNKSVSADGVTENNGTTYAIAALNAGLWSNTSSITQITLFYGALTFQQYTTATLYGIKNS